MMSRLCGIVISTNNAQSSTVLEISV